MLNIKIEHRSRLKIETLSAKLHTKKVVKCNANIVHFEPCAVDRNVR